MCSIVVVISIVVVVGVGVGVADVVGVVVFVVGVGIVVVSAFVCADCVAVHAGIGVDCGVVAYVFDVRIVSQVVVDDIRDVTGVVIIVFAGGVVVIVVIVDLVSQLARTHTLTFSSYQYRKICITL